MGTWLVTYTVENNPFAQAYIRQLNTAARRLLMNLPDGMLDLDAPLSPAEKEAQQRKQ